VYLLGAGPGVADQVAERLAAQSPSLQVVGTYSGSPDPAEEDALIARINAAAPDILFVAYGSPAQEKWLARNLPRLRVKVAMGVGGAFDFVAGITPRAPLWMRRAGLEWLHRLIKQPWRWRRMLRLPRFVWAVLRRGQRGPDSHLTPLRDAP
jgi:N-acetylglucosaminyldiphosphoundecaprenol N-acetyl-beta-D-mannosaminyltransferase